MCVFLADDDVEEEEEDDDESLDEFEILIPMRAASRRRLAPLYICEQLGRGWAVRDQRRGGGLRDAAAVAAAGVGHGPGDRAATDSVRGWSLAASVCQHRFS